MAKDNYKFGEAQRRNGPPGRGARRFEKAKDFKGTWKKLIRYCRKYWPFIITALVCAFAGTVLHLLGPDKLSEMTDLIAAGIMTGIDMNGIARIGFTLIAFYISGAVLSMSRSWIMTSVTQRITRNLRGDISRKINRLPMHFYNRTTTGDVLSRVTNDVDRSSSASGAFG